MRDLSGNVGVEGREWGSGSWQRPRGPWGSGWSCLGLIWEVLAEQTLINMWEDVSDCYVSMGSARRSLSSYLKPFVFLNLRAEICWRWSSRGIRLFWPETSLLAFWLDVENKLVTEYRIQHLWTEEETSPVHVCARVCVCVGGVVPKPRDFLCFSFINRQECVPAVAFKVRVPWALSRSATDIWILTPFFYPYDVSNFCWNAFK